ncbi:hypothetical protein B9Z55_027580 [Caenorhabditis nigoni]|uniref:Uncharacterized protein n=1 Tax=Caenorhabditis nigoni TaxID=1611254 RepID=A0A2G5SFP1_9PELO|nr:hypothetical protein B9Z55_027580 [Caenorhabditis nigoni]
MTRTLSAEKVLSEKVSELENCKKAYKNGIDAAQADFEKRDPEKCVVSGDKIPEAAKKFMESDQVVKQRTEELSTEKGLKDEEIKEVEAIDERLKNN